MNIPAPIEIAVASAEVTEDVMYCCGEPAIRVLLEEYTFSQNRQQFRVKDVWASVCAQCERKFFEPETADQVYQQVRAALYPERRPVLSREREVDND